MHHAVVHHDICAKGVTDALMAETNAEHGNFLAEGADHVVRQARLARRTRAGRHENAFGIEFADFIERDLIIAMDDEVHLHLAQILDEVESKRIVVVDDQDHARA